VGAGFAQTIVNTMVPAICHVLFFYVIFIVSGVVWGIIFNDLGVPWEHFGGDKSDRKFD
jgi:hypothetical protein